MARKETVTVQLTDDIDGGKADRTVKFGWDGATYEIDLSKKNAAALEKAVAPYLGSARKVRAANARATRKSAAGERRTDLADIRAWARGAGYEISDRGRIPAAVVSAYDAG